jgi:hypothetical protein
MSHQKQTICLVCAWREHCVKRFNMGTSETLFCPDFSEDLILRKATAEAKAANDDKTAE